MLNMHLKIKKVPIQEIADEVFRNLDEFGNNPTQEYAVFLMRQAEKRSSQPTKKSKKKKNIKTLSQLILLFRIRKSQRRKWASKWSLTIDSKSEVLSEVENDRSIVSSNDDATNGETAESMLEARKLKLVFLRR